MSGFFFCGNIDEPVLYASAHEPKVVSACGRRIVLVVVLTGKQTHPKSEIGHATRVCVRAFFFVGKQEDSFLRMATAASAATSAAAPMAPRMRMPTFRVRRHGAGRGWEQRDRSQDVQPEPPRRSAAAAAEPAWSSAAGGGGASVAETAMAMATAEVSSESAHIALLRDVRRAVAETAALFRSDVVQGVRAKLGTEGDIADTVLLRLLVTVADESLDHHRKAIADRASYAMEARGIDGWRKALKDLSEHDRKSQNDLAKAKKDLEGFQKREEVMLDTIRQLKDELEKTVR